MRAAVIDSSPLINLVHLDLAKELSLFFDVIYVPRSVQREVNRKQRFRYRLRKLYQTSVFQRCVTADRYNVEMLKIDVHEGEAEALVQAQEQGAAFFIGDEKRAREISLGMTLKPVGTVRLLARLHLEGRASEARALVKKLQTDLRFRVAENVLEEALARASEPI